MVNNFNKDSSLARSVGLLALSFAIVLITLNFPLQAETTSVCPAGCQYGSIQNAVGATRPGDTIKVKAGTYKENVKIDKDLSLVGEGKNKIRIEGGQKGHPVIRIGPGRVQVELKGLTIAGAKGELCANSEKNLCPDGVSVSGQAKVDMVNCSMASNGRYGIYLGDDSQASVISSQISNNGGTGIMLWDSARATLTDNQVVENKGLGISSWTEESIGGSGNEIIGNQGGLVGALPGRLRKKLREPSEEKITLPDKHYPTLQHAVDALLPGGKIELKEGKYQGGVVIDKQVTIVGNGKQRTTIQGGYPGLSLIQDGALTLKNVGIVNNTKGIIGAGNSKAKLKNCAVSENKIHGAKFKDSSQAKVEDCTISDNGGSGLYFFNSAQGNLKESTFSENVEGISPADSSQVKIQNCVLRGNEVGLDPSSKSRAKVKNTKIEDSKYAGIDAGGSSQVIVEDCDIAGNGSGIESRDSSSVTLLENRIKNNERAGVAGDSSQAVQGRGNEIVDNGVPMKGNFSEGVREKLREPTKERITLPDKDYPTLQHAVDALLPGGKIELKQGEYQGGVLIDKQLTITGKEGKETVIKGDYAGLTLLKDAELTLKNLQIDSEAEGLFLAGDSKAYLHNLTVRGNRRGIELSDSSQAEVEGCLITENKWSGIYLHGSSRAKLIDSSIHNNGAGIRIYEPKNEGRLTGFGNEVYENGKNFSNVSNEVRKQITESEKPARTGKVCPSGCKYSSIQNAVDKVRAGGVIKVKAGTYKENVKINKDLTLKGVGSSKATIDGAKEGSPIVSVGPDQVKVTIEGLTLCDAEGGGYQEIDEEHRPVGISIKGEAKVEIRNSTVTHNVAGLAPLDSAEFVVYNSKITDNICGFVGGPWANPKLTVKSSTITENIAGFFLSGSTEARVEDSVITDNHVFGVLLYDSSRAIIKNLEVSETQWNGLVLRGSSQARVKESTIKANGEEGIALVGSSDLNLINSRIKDNQKGLIISGGFKGSIEGSGNEISDNETNFKNVPGEDRKQLLATHVLPAPVNFPDEKLEKAIRKAIDKPKGKIYPKDLEGLKRLRADAKGIKNLEGIEYCKDLEVLSLEENNISDLSPLSQLRKLSQLDLEKNGVSDIDPLSNLTGLEKLDLADNRVASLKPIAELDSLVGLWLYNNDISDITPLSDLAKLRRLWLIDNEVSDLSPLSGLKNLVDLYLIDNEVSDIEPLSGLTALKTLALSGNQISDLGPLLKNPGLGPGDYIGLSANKLDTFMGSKDVEDAQTLRDRGATVEYGMQRHKPIKVSNGEISVQAMDYGYIFDLRYPKGSSNSFMGEPVSGGNIFLLDFHLPGRSPYRPYMKDHQSIYSFGQWNKVNKRTMRAVYSYKKLRVEVTVRLPQEGSFFEKVYEIKNIGDEPLENGKLYDYTHPNPNGTSKGTSKYLPKLNMIYSTSNAGQEKYLGVLSPDLKMGHDLSLTSQYSPKESLNRARKGQLNENIGPISGNTQFIFAGNLGSLAPGEKVARSVYFICGDELTELKELAVKQLRSK